ncbi:hypothetical protein T07_12493 [Trichinella nelsoni]|uniref:Uncharacterized protein n=1 Tax=Trichinella nelsoni TaxID=6336 RepID=A0A0V0RKY7_9BILA|nr:hypothetical protein T07_12493 [Trichinella nelsoni]
MSMSRTARKAICKEPLGATVTLTNKPPDISRTLLPRMYSRTSLPKETAEMNVFSAKKGYTETVFRPTAV